RIGRLAEGDDQRRLGVGEGAVLLADEGDAGRAFVDGAGGRGEQGRGEESGAQASCEQGDLGDSEEEGGAGLDHAASYGVPVLVAEGVAREEDRRLEIEGEVVHEAP